MGKYFNPGDFRYGIIFLKPPSGTDGYGEPSGDWKQYRVARASKEPLIGRELYTALSADTKVEVKFKTRYMPGVTNDMRIMCGTELYEIISAVDVDARHKELLCYCRMVKEDGGGHI